MSTKKKIIVILGIIFALAGLTAGGYAGWQYWQSQQVEQVMETETDTITLPADQDQIDWGSLNDRADQLEENAEGQQ